MHKSDMIFACLMVILKEQYYLVQITKDGIGGMCTTQEKLEICPKFQSKILMEDAPFKTKACMDV